MAGRLLSFVLLVLSSCCCMLVRGQTCSLSAGEFGVSTVNVSAVSVGHSTPAARVIWSTVIPPECVKSVTVEFRTQRFGSAVATNTTTNTSQTDFIQTGLRCGANYSITVVVTGETSDGVQVTRSSRPVRVVVGDIPAPVQLRAEVTADNASISVSWQWSRQGVPMCVNLVTLRYRPERGSQMSYTVGSTPITSAILPNLQCDVNYTISVYASGGQTGITSVSRVVFVPVRAPPTPTEVTAEATSVSNVRVAWQWSSSPNCFNTTSVTYRPEGGDESFLQLSDPAATEATLTDLHNNTCYTITVVATAGGHRRESIARTVTLPRKVIPAPVIADITASSTSMEVSWDWSPSGVPTCVDLVQVHYQPEGGSLMMYTVDDTTATSATLPNLQCNAEYTIWVYVESGSNKTGNMSATKMISIPARAPPTPILIIARFMNTSSVKVTWQWTSSGPAPNCFNTTTVTYRPEGGYEVSLPLRDPAATAATLTDLQCSTRYTITVVATAGVHRSEGATQGTTSMCPTAAPETPSDATSQSFTNTASQSSTGTGSQSSTNTASQLSTDPNSQSSTGTGSQSATNTQSSTNPGPQQSSNSGLVAGVAVFVVVLVLAAIGIVVIALIIWWRRKQSGRKDAVVELAAINAMTDEGRDSKEKQDTVENVCYEKIQILPPTIVDYQRERQE